jgi:putative methyltransferase (TIGR04325 family)
MAQCRFNSYMGKKIADVVFRKTKRLIDANDFDALVGVSGRIEQLLGLLSAKYVRRQTGALNVLDLGGACGGHYFPARASLPGTPLRWCVVETPTMIARAGKLATDKLQFRTSVAEAQQWLGEIHLVNSFTALQYFPDPLKALVEITSIGADVILLSRIGLTQNEGFTIIQTSQLSANGPGPMPEGIVDEPTSYPATFLNQKAFENAVSPNYTIVARYSDGFGNYDTEREYVKGHCYLLLKR